ncbi:MAG: indole-3-glycerol phosphate synthase TrpC [Desulfobacterales bacterium]|nr:indole-3-glycerol phosphate synthase TrpC [Desulfobacterales bacterium]
MTMDILTRIVEYKKEEVAEAKKETPENRLRAEAEKPRERRSFFKALEHPGPAGVNIIAEIKRASPSKGVIRKNLDPADQASVYEKGGAAALSVLTDRHFFQGCPEDLQKARAAARLPALRKDFTIDAYQVYESAVMGADAILLIARILSKQQLGEYLDLGASLGLDALVEIHSPEDLEAANQAGARLIGINNRNLASFETDIRTAMTLSSLLRPDQIPVAASGIQGRKDIEQNLDVGIHNFLIGESLVRSEDPQRFLRSLSRGD